MRDCLSTAWWKFSNFGNPPPPHLCLGWKETSWLACQALLGGWAGGLGNSWCCCCSWQLLLSTPTTTTTFPPSGLFGFGSTICWSPWILGLQGLLLAVWTRNAGGGGITATFKGGLPTTAAWFRKRISQCSKSLETEFTCRQLGPVLIVLELVPLTLQKLKDDNKAREVQIFCKSSRYPLTPCTPPAGGQGAFPRWRECLK